MKDFYQALGLPQDATSQEVKKAYRKLAMTFHPDKGGDPAIMAILNSAYETLIDPIKRRDFDERWKTFQATCVEKEPEITITDYLTAGDLQPYSQTFRKQHHSLVTQFGITPLKKGKAKNYFTTFTTNLYSFGEGRRDNIIIAHDIFTFVRLKSGRSLDGSLAAPTKQKLQLDELVKIFMDFLAGNYYGEQLNKLREYLVLAMPRIKTIYENSRELLLYEGIVEIILITGGTSQIPNTLLLSIKKITDFAKQVDEATLLSLTPIFYLCTRQNSPLLN